jgi:signal transduction histidine kinase
MPVPSALRRLLASDRTLLLRGSLVLACAFAMVATLRAQPAAIEPPGSVLSETGAPAFEIYTPAALGLSSPPTDLHPMPDGRILAVAGRELALGDGTRWEVHSLALEDTAIAPASVAITPDGTIFAGSNQTFTRVEFGTDGLWRRIPLVELPQLDHTATNIESESGLWYWHCSGGAVVAWKPGTEPAVVAHLRNPQRAFSFGGCDYLGDESDGSLWQLTPGVARRLSAPKQVNVGRAITCGLELGQDRYLVGTGRDGIQYFDEGQLTPFVDSGPLGAPNHIGDLCATTPGLYAAAVADVGIVFFDRQGNTVQVLGRALDHRLARVQRLFYMREGVVWALLDDGLARVVFPSRISNYDSMFASGLIHAKPVRIGGKLWMLGDGVCHRGVYDDTGHLQQFEVDSPPGAHLSSLAVEDGRLLACTAAGIYRRDPSGWTLVVPSLPGAHIGDLRDAEGRRPFIARNLAGWIQPRGEGFEVRSFPQPELGIVYGAVTDRHGVLWGELGVARIARIELVDGTPRVEIFGEDNGLTGGWAQLAILDGEVHVDIVGRLLAFDAEHRRFIPAPILAGIPTIESGSLIGRPCLDATDRLWIATHNGLRMFERQGTGFRPSVEIFPSSLQPLHIAAETGGPVWFHQRGRLLRYDPSMPLPGPSGARALITRMQFPNSRRTLHLPRGAIPPLPFGDNSFVVHFMAIGAPPMQTVTFEVRLAGASGAWLSTGVVGTTTFSQLKEGAYTLQVRPVVQGAPGPMTELSLTIEPPWFRTATAYFAYALGALAFIAFVAWYAGWHERRGKARLEHLVALRTKELNDANRQLAGNMQDTLRHAAALRASEERYRQLSTELEHRVADRTEALVRTNDQLVASNQELESFSYSISHDLRAPLRNINGFVDLLRRRNRDNLDAESHRFFQIISTETIRLSQLIDSLLAFARLSRSDLKFERVSLGSLVTQVVAELRPEYENRLVDWKLGPLPSVDADPALLRQVVANLLSNAIKFTRNRQPAVIEIGAQPFDDARHSEHVIFVRDNGAGFDPKYASKLFGVFQRLHHTRDFEGTGIGLANAKRIVLRHGGRIWAEGLPGAGATFYFALPSRTTTPAPEPPAGH